MTAWQLRHPVEDVHALPTNNHKANAASRPTVGAEATASGLSSFSWLASRPGDLKAGSPEAAQNSGKLGRVMPREL